MYIPPASRTVVNVDSISSNIDLRLYFYHVALWVGAQHWYPQSDLLVRLHLLVHFHARSQETKIAGRTFPLHFQLPYFSQISFKTPLINRSSRTSTSASYTCNNTDDKWRSSTLCQVSKWQYKSTKKLYGSTMTMRETAQNIFIPMVIMFPNILKRSMTKNSQSWRHYDNHMPRTHLLLQQRHTSMDKGLMVVLRKILHMPWLIGVNLDRRATPESMPRLALPHVTTTNSPD